MDQRIRNKIQQLKKLAGTSKADRFHEVERIIQGSDGLSQAIHSKKDADVFMAELRAIAKQAE